MQALEAIFNLVLETPRFGTTRPRGVAPEGFVNHLAPVPRPLELAPPASRPPAARPPTALALCAGIVAGMVAGLAGWSVLGHAAQPSWLALAADTAIGLVGVAAAFYCYPLRAAPTKEHRRRVGRSNPARPRGFAQRLALPSLGRR